MIKEIKLPPVFSSWQEMYRYYEKHFGYGNLSYVNDEERWNYSREEDGEIVEEIIVTMGELRRKLIEELLPPLKPESEFTEDDWAAARRGITASDYVLFKNLNGLITD